MPCTSEIAIFSVLLMNLDFPKLSELLKSPGPGLTAIYC